MNAKIGLIWLVVSLLLSLTLACGSTNDASDDDDDAGGDDDESPADDDNDDDTAGDDDATPPDLAYSGWVVPSYEKGAIYRITDGVWDELSIPEGFEYATDRMTAFGSLVYTWQRNDAVAVWRLADDWRELFRNSGEDEVLRDVAFFAEDSLIGYEYDNYNQPPRTWLIQHDPVSGGRFIYPDLNPRGVFAGFDDTAYAFDAETIYSFDGVNLAEVATFPAGDIRDAGPLGEGFFVVTGDAVEYWDGASWSTLIDSFFGMILSDADGDILVSEYGDYENYQYRRMVDGELIPNRWFGLVDYRPSALLPGDAAIVLPKTAPEGVDCPPPDGGGYRIIIIEDEASCDTIPHLGGLWIKGNSASYVGAVIE
jgi:hypothetical protein